MQQFIVTIEGHGFSDVDEIEMLRLPAQGEPIDTKYGTCIVTAAERLLEPGSFDGAIVCRLP